MDLKSRAILVPRFRAVSKTLGSLLKSIKKKDGISTVPDALRQMSGNDVAYVTQGTA